MHYVVNASPFSFHLSIVLDCRSFPLRDGNFLFRFIRVVASLFEASRSFSWSTFTRFWASWKYFSSSKKGFEYGLPYKGLFACLSMNDNKYAEDFKVSLLAVKKDSHLTTMNFVIFWHTPHFSFLRRLFSLSFTFVFNCQRIYCYSRRYCLNPACLLQIADS